MKPTKLKAMTAQQLLDEELRWRRKQTIATNKREAILFRLASLACEQEAQLKQVKASLVAPPSAKIIPPAKRKFDLKDD